MNPTKVEQFVGQVLTDLAASYSGMLVNLAELLIKHRLDGKRVIDDGPVTVFAA